MRGSKPLVLTPKQRQELQTFIKATESPRARDRARAVLAVSDGQSRQAIARVFQVSRLSIPRWIDWFLEAGAAGLPDAPRPGKAPALSPARAQELCVIACQRPTLFGHEAAIWTLSMLQKEVEQRWQLKVSDETIRRELHRGKLSFKSPKLHLHSPDPQYVKKRGMWSA